MVSLRWSGEPALKSVSVCGNVNTVQLFSLQLIPTPLRIEFENCKCFQGRCHWIQSWYVQDGMSSSIQKSTMCVLITLCAFYGELPISKSVALASLKQYLRAFCLSLYIGSAVLYCEVVHIGNQEHVFCMICTGLIACSFVTSTLWQLIGRKLSIINEVVLDSVKEFFLGRKLYFSSLFGDSAPLFVFTAVWYVPSL